MKITDATITISAVSPKQYPNDPLAEIALAGRSNVGKSSFINCMLGRKNLARTSSKPGKTQTLNFYKINQKFYFVDVPGYGYAKVSKRERKAWGPMMETYFESRDELLCVILIIDSRHKPTQDDIQMYEYLKYLQLPVLIVATKYDKVKKNERAKSINRMTSALHLHPDDLIVPFSAITGEGKEEVWNILKQFPIQ